MLSSTKNTKFLDFSHMLYNVLRLQPTVKINVLHREYVMRIFELMFNQLIQGKSTKDQASYTMKTPDEDVWSVVLTIPKGNVCYIDGKPWWGVIELAFPYTYRSGMQSYDTIPFTISVHGTWYRPTTVKEWFDLFSLWFNHTNAAPPSAALDYQAQLDALRQRVNELQDHIYTVEGRVKDLSY